MTLGRPVQISIRLGWPLFSATTYDFNGLMDDQLDVQDGSGSALNRACIFFRAQSDGM
jgi:hypothetical protein